MSDPLFQQMGNLFTRKMRYGQEILQATVVADNQDGTYDVVLKGNSGTMKRVPYIGQGTIRVNDTLMVGNYDGDRQRPQIIQGAGAQSSPNPLAFDLAPNNNWQNSGAANGNYVGQIVTPNQPIQNAAANFSGNVTSITLPVNPSFSNYVIEAAVGQTVFLRSQFWEIVQAFNIQTGVHLFDLTPPNGLQDAWFDQTGIYFTTLDTGSQTITVRKYSISTGTLIFTSANKYTGTIASGNNLYTYTPVVNSPNNFKTYVIGTNLCVYFETTASLVVNVLNSRNNPGTYSTTQIFVCNMLAVDVTSGKGILYQKEISYGDKRIDLFSHGYPATPPGRNPIGFIQLVMVFVPDGWNLNGSHQPTACCVNSIDPGCVGGYQTQSYNVNQGLDAPFGTASIFSYNTGTIPATVTQCFNLTPVVSHVFYSYQQFSSANFPSTVGFTDLNCPQNPPNYLGAPGTIGNCNAGVFGHLDFWMVTANATTGVTAKRIASISSPGPVAGVFSVGFTTENTKNQRLVFPSWLDMSAARWIAGYLFDGIAGTLTQVMPPAAYVSATHQFLTLNQIGVATDTDWIPIGRTT